MIMVAMDDWMMTGGMDGWDHLWLDGIYGWMDGIYGLMGGEMKTHVFFHGMVGWDSGIMLWMGMVTMVLVR